jgi:hypothetical protein
MTKLTKIFGFEEKGKKNDPPIPRGRERSCEGKKKICPLSLANDKELKGKNNK